MFRAIGLFNGDNEICAIATGSEVSQLKRGRAVRCFVNLITVLRDGVTLALLAMATHAWGIGCQDRRQHQGFAI